MDVYVTVALRGLLGSVVRDVLDVVIFRVLRNVSLVHSGAAAAYA